MEHKATHEIIYSLLPKPFIVVHIINKQKTVWVQHDKNIYNEECFIYLNTINNRDYIRNQISYPYFFAVYP